MNSFMGSPERAPGEKELFHNTWKIDREPRNISDEDEGHKEGYDKGHSLFRNIHGLFLGNVSCHEKIETKRRRCKPDGQAANEDNAKVNRINSQFLAGWQQNRSQDNDSRPCIHDHSKKQEDNDKDTQDSNAGMEISQDESFHGTSGASQAKDTAKSCGKCQNEGQAAIGLDRFNAERPKFLKGNSLINERETKSA